MTVTGFASRHLGPRPDDIAAMLEPLGFSSLDALTDAVVPESIRLGKPLDLPAARSDVEALPALRAMSAKNQEFRS